MKSRFSISEITLRCRGKPVMNWTKGTVIARLYLMRIHFLIIKVFIVKGFTYAIVKILH